MSKEERCPNCERLEKLIVQLQTQSAQQAARIEELERKLAAATKNSANSSKPPSSDIVKPPSKRMPVGKRKKGGQKGHKRVVRPDLADDELDWLMQYSYEACPDCGGPVTVDTESPASILQQIEIVTKPTEATEHQALACHCAACEKTHVATIPAEVRKAGLCGPELTSIIGLLKGACHASFATIRKYLRDVYGLKLSRGLLAKVIGKVSEAIAPLYEGLFEQAIRFVVIDRKVTQGSKSEKGQRWLERIWTLMATCEQQGLSLLNVIRGAVSAHFDGDLPPPLPLPD